MNWKERKEDIFIALLWNKGLKTGDSVYFSMEDLENGNIPDIPELLKNDILEAFRNLSFTDLKKLSNEEIDELLNNEAFCFQCFSFYKDFEEYISSHKCYVSKDYVFSRDGAVPYATYRFYVFL